MKNYLSVLGLSTILAFSSCSKDEIVKAKESDTITYLHNSKEIRVEYKSRNGDVEMLNNNQKNELENIFANKNLVIYQDPYDESKIHLFDNQKDFEGYLFSKSDNVTSYWKKQWLTNYSIAADLCPTINPSPLQVYGAVEFWVDANMTGAVLNADWCTGDPSKSCNFDKDLSTLSNINGVNWEDKISSLRIRNGNLPEGPCMKDIVVTLYEHGDYNGQSLAFVARRYQTVNVPKLDEYKYGSLFNRKHWNDRLSSLKIRHTILN
ncbi:hypothetical protein HER32_13600 [Hymenobacter sp. BT18]|uniref:hypothetical protein n=1 Tax=Hymenobacter sp. BT18 TaxID=2835648 RepID=UPI00143EEF28|nr:hypothetical protein [Hymenobacter sp. BT18]QIX62159.1 hypothetical protein HER32_13600 [Hymenobacter sp. BT18]